MRAPQQRAAPAVGQSDGSNTVPGSHALRHDYMLSLRFLAAFASYISFSSRIAAYAHILIAVMTRAFELLPPRFLRLPRPCGFMREEPLPFFLSYRALFSFQRYHTSAFACSQ